MDEATIKRCRFEGAYDHRVRFGASSSEWKVEVSDCDRLGQPPQGCVGP